MRGLRIVSLGEEKYGDPLQPHWGRCRNGVLLTEKVFVKYFPETFQKAICGVAPWHVLHKSTAPFATSLGRATLQKAEVDGLKDVLVGSVPFAISFQRKNCQVGGQIASGAGARRFEVCRSAKIQ